MGYYIYAKRDSSPSGVQGKSREFVNESMYGLINSSEGNNFKGKACLSSQTMGFEDGVLEGRIITALAAGARRPPISHAGPAPDFAERRARRSFGLHPDSDR